MLSKIELFLVTYVRETTNKCVMITGSDFCLTCDDYAIRRYPGKTHRVLNPVDFVLEVTGGQR